MINKHRRQKLSQKEKNQNHKKTFKNKRSELAKNPNSKTTQNCQNRRENGLQNLGKRRTKGAPGNIISAGSLFLYQAGCGSFWPFSRWLSGPSSAADNERAPLRHRHQHPLSLRVDPGRCYNRYTSSPSPRVPTGHPRFTSVTMSTGGHTRMRPNQREPAPCRFDRSSPTTFPSLPIRGCSGCGHPLRAGTLPRREKRWRIA